MKHKTLFRVLLKILGVYFVGVGGTALLGQMYWFWSVQAGGTPFDWSTMFPALLGVAATIGFGFYLFFGGKWIADKAIPGNRPYCLECGYDLTGAADGRSSECGTPFRSEDVEPRADH